MFVFSEKCEITKDKEYKSVGESGYEMCPAGHERLCARKMCVSKNERDGFSFDRVKNR